MLDEASRFGAVEGSLILGEMRRWVHSERS